MKWMLWVGVVIVSVSCGQTPNPRSCLDGSCTDPEFPYCDVEGLIETPMSCVAVECSPGEFRACRGEQAITCNPTGNNFDLVECPNGCAEPDGCLVPEVIECMTNDDCDNPKPICSTDMTCRGCAADDECASGVCDIGNGSCAGESEVVYTSPGGTDIATCTTLDPCSLPRAVTVASSNPLRPWIKLAAGTYTGTLKTNMGTIRVVGPRTAILRGTTTNGNIIVGLGGKATLRGMTIDLTMADVLCGGYGTAGGFVDGGELHIEDTYITAPSRLIAFTNGCVGSIRRSVFVSNLDAGSIIVSRTSGSVVSKLTVDQLRMEGVVNQYSQFRISDGAQATVTNSVFQNVFVTYEGGGAFAFSTIYGKPMNAVPSTARVENNIIVAPGVPSSFTCTSCISRSNITFPQTATIAGTTVVDPQFVDATNHDYHLKTTSPALNAAMPQPDLTTDHDFEGIARPQGAALDIGAYELVP